MNKQKAFNSLKEHKICSDCSTNLHYDFEFFKEGLCEKCYYSDKRTMKRKSKLPSMLMQRTKQKGCGYNTHAQMKRFNEIEQKEKEAQTQTACDTIVTTNIKNVRDGKELTAPLAYLNRSCEFRKVWEKVNNFPELRKQEYAQTKKRWTEKNREKLREYQKQRKERIAWEKSFGK